MKKPIVWLLIHILLIVGHFAEARLIGGGTDGGGNAVLINNKPVLLDLVVSNRQSHAPSPKGHPMIVRSNGSDTAYFVVPSDQKELMTELEKRLQLWSQSVVTEQIKIALKNTEFWANKNNKIPHETRYFIPPEYESKIFDKDILTVASYSYNRNGGAEFNLLLYNKMDLDSQIGIWIHESLRSIQQAEAALSEESDLTKNDILTDETLQNLTAKIVFGPRQGDEKLDETPQLGWLLRKIITWRALSVGPFLQNCQLVKTSTLSLKEFMGQAEFSSWIQKLTNICTVKNWSSHDNDENSISIRSQRLFHYTNNILAHAELNNSVRQDVLFNLLNARSYTESLVIKVIKSSLQQTELQDLQLKWRTAADPNKKVPRYLLMQFPTW